MNLKKYVHLFTVVFGQLIFSLLSKENNREVRENGNDNINDDHVVHVHVQCSNY